MKIVYFAWLRERVGFGEEEVELPSTVQTVSDFFDWMKSRGEEFDAMLEHRGIIRVAIDQEHVEDHDALIGSPREIALFPPMTGG